MPHVFTDSEVELMGPLDVAKAQLRLQQRTQYYEHIQAQAASSALGLQMVFTNMLRSFYVAIV